MSMINRKACAGTLESSDVYVELEPSISGIELNLESAVIEQFGEAIRSAVLDVINEMNISDVKIKVVDRGALDCVIRARVETALSRGMEAHDA